MVWRVLQRPAIYQIRDLTGKIDLYGSRFRKGQQCGPCILALLGRDCGCHQGLFRWESSIWQEGQTRINIDKDQTSQHDGP